MTFKWLGQRHIWLVLMLILIATWVKVWLWSAQSPQLLPFASHDDFLFVRLAASISQSQWLGPVDQLTLAKGPGYPIFISLTAQLGLELIWTQRFWYWIGCLAAAGVAAAFTTPRRRGLIFSLVFIFFLFHPVTLDTNFATRVNRTYLAFLAAFCCQIGVLAALYWASSQRSHAQLWLRFSLLISSLALGWALITREDTGYLLLAFLGQVLVIGYQATIWKSATSLFSFLAVVTGPAVAVMTGVMLLNYQFYRVAIVTEYADPDFRAAYAQLSRVQTEFFYPMVPVSRAAMHQVAAVSSSFQQLYPDLAGQIGANWQSVTASDPANQAPVGEIAGGWFIWALKDAVAASGYYQDFPSTFRFYRQLASEVAVACDQQQLRCSPVLPSFLPYGHLSYLPQLPTRLWTLVQTIFFFRELQLTNPPLDPSLLTRLPQMERVLADRMSDTPPTQLQLTVLTWNIRLYQVMVPLLVVLAVTWLWPHRRQPLVWAVSLYLLGTSFLAAIVVLMSLASFTSAIEIAYLSPVSLALALLVIVSWVYRSGHPR